jgi:hypothetical protein
VQLSVTSPETEVRIQTPHGEKIDFKSGKAGKLSFTGTSELGIYDVQLKGKTVDNFAVNLFNSAESDIRPNPSPTIKVGDVEVHGEVTTEAARKEMWKILAILALVILGLEWYIYNRRIY